MSKQGVKPMANSAAKNYPDDFLAPLFGEPGENGEDPIPAKEIMGIRLFFAEPDPRILEIAPNGIKGGRIKVPNEFFKIARPKNGVDKFVYNPFETTEDDFEAHFGKGYYFVQPYDHRNKWLDGRNMLLAGPARFQGEIVEEEPEPEEPEPEEPEDDPLVEKIEALAESQKQANDMFREALKPAPAPETAVTRLKEVAEIAAIFKPPADTGLARAEDANARRIDDLMREHRKDLEKRDTAISEARQDYRTELDSIRKKFETDVESIRTKADKAIEEAKSDYKDDLADRKKLFEESRSALLKQIERLEGDLHDRDGTIDQLALKRGELESKLLSANVLKEEAERHAKAAEKDADELEDRLNKAEARVGKGGVVAAADSVIPGLPGWVNNLIPLAPIILPIVANALKSTNTPIPSDLPPFLQEQLRAAMAQQPQQGAPPGWPQQQQQGWGPPPGWVPVPQQQQPPPGWVPQQQPPPGWVPVPQPPQQPWGPPPGWAGVPPQQPSPYEQPNGAAFGPFGQPAPNGYPQAPPNGYPQTPPSPFGPGPSPYEHSQTSGAIPQQPITVVQQPEPIVAVRTASPVIEDEGESP